MGGETLAADPHQTTWSTDAGRVTAVNWHRLFECHRGGHAFQVFEMRAFVLIRPGFIRL